LTAKFPLTADDNRHGAYFITITEMALSRIECSVSSCPRSTLTPPAGFYVCCARWSGRQSYSPRRQTRRSHALQAAIPISRNNRCSLISVPFFPGATNVPVHVSPGINRTLWPPKAPFLGVALHTGSSFFQRPACLNPHRMPGEVCPNIAVRPFIGLY